VAKGVEMIFRTKLKQIVAVFSVASNNPELLLAQYKAFCYQIPLMYVILMINTWAVAVTHLNVAPRWTTTYIPIAMTLVCVTRIIAWICSLRREPTPEIARRAMVRTNRLSGMIALVFTGWALSLFPYGDAYAKAHVAFYMAITVVGVIFCLMHLRSAALFVAIIVNAVFFVFFALTGNLVFLAIAANTALVSITMLIILMGHYRDFTRMVDAQAENLRLANRDSLTSLPNRRAFFALLNRACASAKADGTKIGVGVIDLDGFKPVNDLYGHALGDRLLYEVAQRLSRMCAETVHVARLGGDEFSLVVHDLSSESELLVLGEQICAMLRTPIILGEITVQIAGSIGFAVYPDMALDATDVFEHADYALYYGKRTCRGSATLFSAEHDAEIRRDLRIEQALKVANFKEELTTVFQPIIDVSSQSTIGFEALARWASPVLGHIPPALFIPVAERMGIISGLTQVLLKKALAIAACWPSHIRLSFNLSAHDLSSSNTVLDLIRIIHDSGFDPKCLDLEITETAFINDIAQLQQATESLRTIGCGISLDDFGTGYSSLTHLHALPLTKIKIDRSFVSNLHKNPASYKIVKSLLALSRDMGIGCIIEGVETKEEMAALGTLGGLTVQGYFYSKPIGSDKVAEFLASASRDQCSEESR
jgi:diguanylate cyclase (GGDEF)-like protein